MGINKRKLHETYISSNLSRLSDESLERIVNKIEDEVDKAIKKEMDEQNHD